MSDHMFGLGDGFLSKRVAAIARKHGAELHNYTDAQCRCGANCKPHTCKAARRHWFTCQNLGEPFNSDRAREVMEALPVPAHLQLEPLLKISDNGIIWFDV